MEEKKIIRDALFEEDKIHKDLTSSLLPAGEKLTEAVMISKSSGIICGTVIVSHIFKTVYPRTKIKIFIPDGNQVKAGDKILLLRAPAKLILSAERTALNFIQRLSGIASLTNKFVSIAKPYGVRIYDTRKTTPGLRLLEKYAVRVGGGVNHRMNLSEMVFVKDNHLAICPDITYWINNAHRKYGKKVTIEIECTSFQMAKQAVESGADVVLLDNMSYGKLKKYIPLLRRIDPNVVIEISGGINLKNLSSIARLKPDRISVGALTHSAPSLDISLEVVKK